MAFHHHSKKENNMRFLPTLLSHWLHRFLSAITISLLLAACGSSGDSTNPPANQFDLTVQVRGTGNIQSTPAGLNCNTECVAAFDESSSVALAAVPASGFRFVAWTGACTGISACALTMDQAKTVVATFEAIPAPRTFGLTISLVGSGSVSSQPAGINCGTACTADFADATLVTLTATPSANNSFSEWTGACSGSSSCTVTMNQIQTVGAKFIPIPATIQFSLTLAVTGNGTVTSAPTGINCGATCTAQFDSGTSVALTATPAAGQVFSGWTGACSGALPSCTLQLSQQRAAQATFAPAPVASAFQVAQLLESNNDFNVGGSRVAVNRLGDAIAIWEQSDGVPNGSTQKVYSRRYQVATGWQAAVAVTDLIDTVNHIVGSELLLDDAGVATWIQTNNNMQTRRNSPTSGWGAVFVAPNPRLGVQLSAAMDINGNIRVLRSGSDVESNTLPAGGTWGAWVLVDNAGSAVSSRAKIAQNSDGTALAVWRESNPGDNNRSMKAARFTPTGGWSTPESIEQLFTNVEDADPSVVIDSQGNGIAMWQQNANLYYNIYRQGAGWQGAVEVAGQTQALPNAAIQLAMTADGRAVVTWFVGGGLGTLRGMQYSPATGWTAPANIGGSNFDRKMFIDNNGQAMMTYRSINETTAKWDVLSQRLSFGGLWSTPIAIETAGGDTQNSNFAMNQNGQGVAIWAQSDAANSNVRNSFWSAVLR
jgi:Fe-S cluster biogenesis protein NfuA